jgi:hypothetical protein
MHISPGLAHFLRMVSRLHELDRLEREHGLHEQGILCAVVRAQASHHVLFFKLVQCCLLQITTQHSKTMSPGGRLKTRLLRTIWILVGGNDHDIS